MLRWTRAASWLFGGGAVEPASGPGGHPPRGLHALHVAKASIVTEVVPRSRGGGDNTSIAVVVATNVTALYVTLTCAAQGRFAENAVTVLICFDLSHFGYRCWYLLAKHAPRKHRTSPVIG